MTTVALLLLFNTYSAQMDLPKDLLKSLCYVESKHTISAIHKDDGGEDSLGICQIKLSTGKWLGFKGTAKDLMKPKNNIRYAAKFLAWQLHRYHGNVNKALIAYNRGNATGLLETKYSVAVNNEWKGN
jgi:soluble lytic murein transglycosylase-like protein